TQSSAQKFVNPFQIRLDRGRFATGNAPSDTPSGGEVVFGQPTEGNYRNVGRDRGHGDVRVAVDDQLVVNFIGEDHEVALAREFGNLLKHLPRADRAGGIVRIDQHNPTGARRDLFLQVVEI